MLQGCPVITSNHPAILEAVDVAAETFDPFDLEDIKQKIEKVLYDRSYKEALIKNGFKQSKLFTWNKCASETLDVYNKIQIK
jgi:glycosyltransferase involved in cell wall biosynthesis